ncbi:MAG: flagellar FlbD family protein [Planctomycetota bacterium]|jgi:flagellar protein FlbD
MIRVTHLNGKPFVVNAELVKFIEETPDTVLSMRDGDRIVVRESASEVVSRAVEYGRSVRGLGWAV